MIGTTYSLKKTGIFVHMQVYLLLPYLIFKPIEHECSPIDETSGIRQTEMAN
jgi:hypothetical protein